MPRSRAQCCSDKMRCVLNTGAEICTASDNSCLMQIGGALSRQRTGVRCLHLAEILAGTEEGAAMSVRVGEAATARTSRPRRKSDGEYATASQRPRMRRM